MDPSRDRGGTPWPRERIGRHSVRLARLRRLVRQGEEGLAVVDGPKLIHELLARGVEIEACYGTAEALNALAAEAVASRVAAFPLLEVEPTVIERVAPTRQTQGAVAVVRYRLTPLRLAAPILFLDTVQDPANVGAAIRCAAAFGAGGVACSSGCGNPFSAKAIRASTGLSLTFPVAVDVDLDALAARVRREGGAVVGATAAGGLAPGEWIARLPLILALGSEGQGLSEATLKLCQQLITIPLAAPVESLNVAVTAGILLGGLAGLVPSPILDR